MISEEIQKYKQIIYKCDNCYGLEVSGAMEAYHRGKEGLTVKVICKLKS